MKSGAPAMSGGERQRILLTADAVSSVWTYAMELIRAFPQYQWALAVMGPRMTEQQRIEAAQFANVKLFASTYALEWMEGPWEQVDRGAEWLLGIASEFKPDIVHLNGYSHAALPFDAAIVVAAHSCVLSWWRAVRNTVAPPQYNEYRRRVSAGLEAADLVIAPTEAMLHSLRMSYEFRGEGRVIPHACDPGGFRAGTKIAKILAVGPASDEAKNLPILDAIAPRLRWPVEIARETTHPAELRERLSETSIFVLPSRYEPFAFSALEAGRSGCALVLGDIPSLREIWGEAAVFVDPDDRLALEKALNNLIRDDRSRADLAERARARAQEYSPERMIADYQLAYADCRRDRKSKAAA